MSFNGGKEGANGVKGLLRRCQEIAIELEVVQIWVRQLVIEIDAVGVTIRLFRPGAEVGLALVRSMARRQAVLRGESTRMIQDTLSDAWEPLTTWAVVRMARSCVCGRIVLNHVCAYDVVGDCTRERRGFWTLSVVDEFCRGRVAVWVGRRLGSSDAIDEPTDLFVTRGTPGTIARTTGRSS